MSAFSHLLSASPPSISSNVSFSVRSVSAACVERRVRNAAQDLQLDRLDALADGADHLGAGARQIDAARAAIV